ncbi:MAG: hypothetical protein ACXWR0_17365 [Bdellovibrio sp.]
MDIEGNTEIHNKIIRLLSMTRDNTGSVLLVKIPTLVSFLDLLPQDVLTAALQRMPDIPPPLESPQWVIWFKAVCEKFKIPREKFIEGANVDKGDLSKFEANKLNFGTNKRKRLLKVICSEIGFPYGEEYLQSLSQLEK